MSVMADKDTRKTIRFEQSEVVEIEQAIEANPELNGRPFSNAVRWLVRLALGLLDRPGQDEQE